MALGEIEELCNSCKAQFRSRPTRSFLGFQKVECPSCGKETLYPLTTGYRVAYWVIICLMILAIFYNAGAGQLTIPGLLGIAVIIAIVRDAQIRKRVAQAAAQEGVSPARSAANTGERRVATKLIQALAAVAGFLVTSYGVRAGIKWYKETTYAGATPYERSFIRGLRAQGGYENLLALARNAGDAHQAGAAAMLTTHRGVTLLNADDQAKRVEITDHYLSSAPAADCAALAKSSGDRQTILNRMVSSLDSVTLGVFGHLVAKAFIAATQNPSYRPPELSEDEIVQFLRDVGGGLPQAEQRRFFEILSNVETTATDPDVCWATRTMYRYALGQQGERRTTALRLVTLLEFREQR